MFQVIKLKIGLLKSDRDNKNFKLFEKLGFEVFKIYDLESTDSKIVELINKEYDTIIISNEVASFSEDIIKKYTKVPNVKIIINNK